jgi:hypothetical protein
MVGCISGAGDISRATNNGWLDMVNGLIPDEWESLALSRLPARITNLEIEALFTTFLRQNSAILNISQGVAEACSHPTS